MDGKPKLVIITGRPGSGKTTLAKKLGEIFDYPVLIRDEIKENYVNSQGLSHDELPDNTNKLVSDQFFDMVDESVQNNESLIAEAAFQHKVWEPQVVKWQNDADVSVILCDLDPAEAAKRFAKRGKEDPKREYYHGKAELSVDYNPPILDVSTIVVSTFDGYDPDLEVIKEQLI